MAQSTRGILTLRHPVERGIVQDWTSMQAVIHHTLYNEMHAGDTYRTLFNRPFTPTSQRDQFCKMMFETYNVPAVSFVVPEMLAAWAWRKNYCTRSRHW